MSSRFTVEFRIYGKALDPGAVTELLALEPCQVVLPGTRRGSRIVEEEMWAFNGSEDGEAGSPEWSTLEEGLKSVLEKLWSRRQILLHLVIVGRFLNLSKLVENERSVFGKKVQNPGVARVAQRCANETRIRGAQPLRHCHQGSIDHFLAADTRLVEALFADRWAQFRR